MNVPQIRITSSDAKIGLNIHQPIQKIQQPKADIQIYQPSANITMNKRPSKLTIDQTRALADVGIKPTGVVVKEAANKGYQSFLQGLARRAQQGDQLMKIEKGGSPLASQAKVNGERPSKSFNVGFIPSYNSVVIDYDPGELDIQVSRNKPIIDVRPNKPIHEYTPGTTDVYLAQKPTIDIQFEQQI